jgi:hypothetical protein
MAKYEVGESVFTRKAKGYDKIYGGRVIERRFRKPDFKRVYLPEGLEGYVEYADALGSCYKVVFPNIGRLFMDAFFLTKGTPTESIEVGTESPKKAQGEPSQADFIVDEHGQTTRFEEKSTVTEPIVLETAEVPESPLLQSVINGRQGFLSDIYENERTEAETELIKEVTKDIKDERQRRRGWRWF